MLTLTPSAVEAVDTLLHSSPEVPEDAGLRIASAGESQLSIELVAAPVPGDQVIADGGARVYVDADAASLLQNAQLEARQEGDQIAFGLTPAASSNNGTPPAE